MNPQRWSGQDFFLKLLKGAAAILKSLAQKTCCSYSRNYRLGLRLYSQIAAV